MATEEQIDELVEEAGNEIDELIGDTTTYSMDDALAYYEGVYSHVRNRIEATQQDIKRRDEG